MAVIRVSTLPAICSALIFCTGLSITDGMYIAADTEDAPEEFMDPILSELMRDPGTILFA